MNCSNRTHHLYPHAPPFPEFPCHSILYSCEWAVQINPDLKTALRENICTMCQSNRENLHKMSQWAEPPKSLIEHKADKMTPGCT